MANTTGQKIGTNQGKGQSTADNLALFLKVFGGEVLTAFVRRSVTMDKHMVRTIQNGKSAQFPVMGRTKAAYLKAGESLDDKRKDIKHSEKVITIDGLLTSDVLIFDIEDAMNHYDVRSEYSAQLGESLAIAADGAVLAEMAALCNLPSASNENIQGLGTASVLSIGAKADLSDQAALGVAIIKGLTTARAKLTANYVPAGDRVFYTTPENYSAILAALMPNAANYQALIDPENGSIRNVMGFQVFEVPHLTVGGAGDDRADETANQKHAFPATATGDTKVALDNVVGLFNHRSAVGTVKLKDMALERARRAEYQADQIIGKYAMGHGGLRPEAAGALVFTSASA
ncbi:putative structural protein [Dickeya phage vB_DsoP_JA10]|uniref:Major capsid protein n=1 Tax=Dickeya phage vB_DsoP_JA10 TaxID=2283033 RepID=A0A384ZVX1_9CAUD|nr:major head protein [Dickeya phage vB_DsoP_JA10]AXG66388.1 putative structural protein [Dickeya phage vB_DsoP_JA10]